MSKDIKIGDHVKHKDMDWTDFVVHHIEIGTIIIYSKQMSAEKRGHNGISDSFSYEGNGDRFGHYFADESYLTKEFKMETKFKVGDIVKPNIGESYSTYTFQILKIESDRSFYRCYSKELDVELGGHDGGHDVNGKKRGHWNFKEDGIYLISNTEVIVEAEEFPFKIGDLVEVVKHSHKGMKFQVLHVSEENVVGFSQELCDRGEGHAGNSKGNGKKYGHWNFDHDELKIIKSKQVEYELPGENPEGCPRGIQSTIHSSPVRIASASRPAGSEATAYRFKGTLGSGSISYNEVQPY